MKLDMRIFFRHGSLIVATMRLLGVFYASLVFVVIDVATIPATTAFSRGNLYAPPI